MVRYLETRVLALLLVLLLMSVVVFSFLHLTPGDPVDAMLGVEVEQETKQGLRHELGLDRPLLAQYALWMGRALRGDLGTSIRSRQGVSAIIGEKLPITLELTLAASGVGLAIALGLGLAGALTRMVRSGVLEELGREYVRTARAKGLPPSMVITRHVLRNALLPALTVLGVQISVLLGGAVITEQIFAWPGV